jgi:hypothetical protein
MAANRSRTENWKNCLTQIADRQGSLEIAIKVDHLLNPGSDLIWRVKLLSLGDKEFVVEHPAALGRSLKLNLNTEVVVGMTIGQNRWMFASKVVGARVTKTPTGRDLPGLVMSLPDRVERCSRRQFFRVGTAEFQLPGVECWPLILPATAAAAEVANREAIIKAMSEQEIAQSTGRSVPAVDPSMVDGLPLPTVGPKFAASLQNISGGGLGLIFDHTQIGLVDRHAFLWMRVALQPHIPVPIAMTVRRAHTHMDASQTMYGGFAFDFSFHPQHQKFIVDVLGRYVELVESHQRQIRIDEGLKAA